jgi:phosphoribosyl-AMP cyclohydrolase
MSISGVGNSAAGLPVGLSAPRPVFPGTVFLHRGDHHSMFAERFSVEQVEEGAELAPKFDGDGLIPVVTTDAVSGEVLMHAYMNAEALRNTIAHGEAFYWSRSRQCLWHKGATSGLVQKVVEMRIDDDQDAIWLRVKVEGDASCHVGYRSCFYRSIPLQEEPGSAPVKLAFEESEKTFDPVAVYGDAPNPTRL